MLFKGVLVKELEMGEYIGITGVDNTHFEYVERSGEHWT